ncbi:MAG: hypothetical protein QOI21_1696 [Actinomycetota bacterium]|jgi:hypothetical protein|nr:hypothetical protein [Actinomycetota bacterium]
MGVAGAPAPAPRPEHERSESLKLIGTTVLVMGLVALAVTLAAQLIPDHGRGDTSARAAGQTTGMQPLAAAARVVTHVVSYELLGNGGVRNVTYVAQGAAIAQEREATTPWSKSLQRTGVEGGTEFYSVSAQNAGSGTLRCRIVVDGKVVSENSVSGDRAMVTCAR